MTDYQVQREREEPMKQNLIIAMTLAVFLFLGNEV